MATSGKIHGRTGNFFLGGYDVSGDATAVEYNSATQMAKSTGMGGTTDETFLIGQNTNKIAVKGFFDDDAIVGFFTALKALRGLQPVASFYPAGDGTQGYAALMGAIDIPDDIKVNAPVAGASVTDANFQISGVMDTGIVLLSHVAQTGTGAAQVSAVIDNAASSALGASAHFHILAIDAATTVSAFKVEHSTDNITYGALLTSGLAGTAQDADRQITAATATINRYIRATWTITLNKHATLAVAFHRG